MGAGRVTMSLDYDRSDLVDYLVENYSEDELAKFVLSHQWRFTPEVEDELRHTLCSFGVVAIARQIARNDQYIDAYHEFPGFARWVTEQVRRTLPSRYPLMGKPFGEL